jgi:hypothetical protein
VSADRWHGMRLPPVGVLILGTAPRRPSSVSGAVITRATSGPGKLSRWSSAGTKSSAACAGRWDLLTVGVSVFHPDRGRFRMGVSIRHPQRSPPCGQRAVWWPAEYYIRGICPKCPDRNAEETAAVYYRGKSDPPVLQPDTQFPSSERPRSHCGPKPSATDCRVIVVMNAIAVAILLIDLGQYLLGT